MKAIMLDFGSHYKQIDHAAKLWEDYDITFLGSRHGCQKISTPEINNKKPLGDKYSGYLILLYMIFFSYKYAQIICLTGPEYETRFSYIRRTLWLVFCFIYRNKINLYIKNIDSFERSKLLRMSLKYSNMICFESELQLSIFKKKFEDLRNIKNVITYVYYSDVARDLNEDVYLVESLKVSTDKIIVGLIGQFDLDRRDYKPLLDIFDCSGLENFKFIQIGRVAQKSEEKKLVKKYKDRISFIKEDYTNEELDFLLQQCDFLLSMNNHETGYTEGKGSAAFGEAISSKKLLVIPSFLDEYSEFSKFCLYYNSGNFKEVIYQASILNKEFDKSIFDRYSSGNIRSIINS